MGSVDSAKDSCSEFGSSQYSMHTLRGSVPLSWAITTIESVEFVSKSKSPERFNNSSPVMELIEKRVSLLGKKNRTDWLESPSVAVSFANGN